jgi:protein TonB
MAGATKPNLGSGSPNSGSMTGTRAVAVIGLPTGQPGGTGTAPRGATQPIQLARAEQPPPPPSRGVQTLTTASRPTVVFKPKPEYTAEAIRLHLEGTVSVKIRVTPSGSVEVIGVTSPLGHGLDESAVRAVQSTKFKPAVDASGTPVPWEGIVSVSFQLAG